MYCDIGIICDSSLHECVSYTSRMLNPRPHGCNPSGFSDLPGGKLVFFCLFLCFFVLPWWKPISTQEDRKPGWIAGFKDWVLTALLYILYSKKAPLMHACSNHHSDLLKDVPFKSVASFSPWAKGFHTNQLLSGGEHLKGRVVTTWLGFCSVSRSELWKAAKLLQAW